MSLPAFAVKRPVFTWVFFVGLAFLGLIALFVLPIELYQGASRGIISIVVHARGGLSPVDVEKSITRPIEEAVSSVSHLKKMYSNSREAESRVTLEFEPGTDMRFAALEVREKFSRIKSQLPTEIEKPVIANYEDSDSAILVSALTSETLSPEELRELVNQELKPRLDRVDGVASVEVYGGRVKKILIECDRDKMFAYHVSIERIMDVIGASNVSLLAGSFEEGSYDFAIRTMGAFTSVDEIGELGIKATRQRSIIPLKEVATIKEAYMEPEDYARLNLNDNISLYIKKASLANTIKTVKELQFALDEFHLNHKNDVRVITIADKAKLITRAIHDLRDSLLIGIVLVAAIVYFSFRQWILSFIVLTTIPFAIISTFFFMERFGFSINVMTLSGLSLAVGILVDSAVVVVETIMKKREQGIAHDEAIIHGTEEVWLPLLASHLTSLCVFLPMVLISKEIQMTYQGFAFAVSVALTLSHIVAVMFIPMLLSKVEGYLKPSSETSGKISASFFDRISKTYVQWLRKSFRYRYAMLAVAVVLFLFSSWRIVKRDIDLPSQLEENEFTVIVFPLAGAKLDTNNEVAKKLEDLLKQFSDIEMISSTIQKDDLKIFARLKPRTKRRQSKESIMNEIKEKGNEMVKQIHDEYSLIVDEGASSEESKKMVINIFGLENEALEKLAHDAAGRISKIPGLTNLVMTDLRKRPEYSIVVDRARAAHYGFSVEEIANSIHAQIRGMRPTKFHELKKGLEIETITRLQPIYRQKMEDIQDVYLVSPKDGTQVALKQLAAFYPSRGPQTIDRQDKYRYVFLKGDIHRPLETIAKEVKKALKDMEMPKDYFWRFGGKYEDLVKGKSQLWIGVLLSIVLIYMVLASLYQSYTEPLMIMLAIPLSVVGIYMALWFTRKPLSEQVFLGIIILLGYVVNGSVILIDHINQLKIKYSDIQERLIRAGQDRLRPILITSASTVMGFIPMAISRGESSELWAPLAITMIGGIVSSTLLTLFVVPNFYLYMNDLRQWLKQRSLQYGFKADGLKKWGHFPAPES